MNQDDGINHPSHYGGGDNPYEAIKVIESWGWGYEGCMFNAVKYLLRAGKKSGEGVVKDVRKALWYVDRAMQPQNHRTESQKHRYPGQPGHLSVFTVAEAHDLAGDVSEALTLVYLEELADAKVSITKVLDRLGREPEYLPSGPPLAKSSLREGWKAGEKRCPHDGGKCHHNCLDEEPCYRERGGMRLTTPWDGYPKEGHKLPPLTEQERIARGED
jgi:hypothetical protein